MESLLRAKESRSDSIGSEFLVRFTKEYAPVTSAPSIYDTYQRPNSPIRPVGHPVLTVGLGILEPYAGGAPAHVPGTATLFQGEEEIVQRISKSAVIFVVQPFQFT